jgi:malonyl-CoA O-methyltransferase
VQVANAFHRARSYDRHAAVQRIVADKLADHILTLQLPANPRVLEIGCGTGFLGAGLIGRLPFAHYWMTDIAPGMLDRARERFVGHDNIDFAVMDGAAPSLGGPLDLICSSLAMQWITDLPHAIARLRNLLSPGGRLIFTTLAAGSFATWRAAYGHTHPGTPDYPPAEALREHGLTVSIDSVEHNYANAREFLSALKEIGAGTPRPDYRPLPPAQFRQIMKRFETEGAKADYVIATCVAGPAEPA